MDAIAHMGRILVELEHLNEALLSNPAHPLLGSGSLHASLIKGGQELSSYPDHCTLAIERRTLPGETPEGVEAVLRGIVRHLESLDPSMNIVVRRGIDRSPLETSEHVDVARSIQGAAAQVLGHPAKIAGVPFWTDAALLSAVGIPSLLFGPSGAGAHSIEEWVDLASVEACAEIYLATILDFCS